MSVLILVVLTAYATYVISVKFDSLSSITIVATLTFLVLAVSVLGFFLLQKVFLRPFTKLDSWARSVNRSKLSTIFDTPVPSDLYDLVPDLAALTNRLSLLSKTLDLQFRTQTARVSRKTRSLEILYEVVAALNISRSRDELLSSFLEALVELLDARAASVKLLGPNQVLEDVATAGDASIFTGPNDHAESLNALSKGILTDGKLLIHPIEGIADDIKAYTDVYECIITPVQYRDEMLGVYLLFLENPSAELGDDFRDLITSVGKHLGLALEKSRLDNQARRLAVMEERDILRNELHDTLAQYFVSMRIQVKMLSELLYKKEYRNTEKEVWRLRVSLEEANTSLRELLASFRFKMDERGLITAIEDLVDRFNQDSGITTFFQHEVIELALSPTQEVEIYRIVQEALANVRWHSKATTARVFLLENPDDSYSIIIEDDGVGIDHPSPTSQGREHVGLAIMRERSERLGGNLTVESESGEGTTVFLTLQKRDLPTNTEIK